MKDKNKKKDHLIQELDEARRRITELEDSASKSTQAQGAQQETEEHTSVKPEAIGSPDMDMSSLELSTIMDVPTIQSLMDDFYKLTNMALAILDLKGKVLIAIGWQDICTQYHRIHPQTSLNCTQSDLFLAKNMRQGEYVPYKCKNQLWDVVTPLYIGGKHVGNIYTGQFFYDDETIDEKAFITQAERYGFDRESYLAALRRVPRFSRDRVNALMNFLTKFSVLVSELSFSNVKLARTIKEQQRIAEALRSSEAKYRLLHDSMRDAFVSVDMKGYIKDYNESYLSMLGYLPEEISALTYQDITPEKWHAMETAIVENQILPKGYSDIYEKEYRRKDGTIFPVELRTILLKDDAGNPISMWAIVRDITERKRMERSLVENVARLRTLVQTIPDLIWLKDADGVYLFCNPTFERLYGAKETDIVGKTDYDFVDRELADFFREHDRKAMAAGKPSANEEWLTFADDGYRGLFDTIKTPMYDAGGTLIGVLGIARDITAHKRAKDESLLLAQRLRLATDATSIGIWDWDLKEDRWYATPIYFRMLGYEPDEGFSNRKRWLKLIHPEDRDRVGEKIRAVLAGSDEPYQYEARMLHADGSYRWINVVGRILTKDEQGNAIRMLGVRMDITERKLAEEERLAWSRFFENMDKVARAMHGTNDLDQMMNNVLDTVLSIFGCDRTWLLYPCDPDASSFRVPMEISRPEYPGAKVLNVDVPLSPGEAQNMREALESDEPVTYTAGTERPISTAKQFGVQSQMFVALHPKVGKPWVFGMHQCSYPRIWTAEEKKLFQEIGRRLADVLTSLLTYRELRESEKLYRSLFENMLNGFAYCRMIFDQEIPKDFIYLDVNSAFESLTGLKDVIGKKVSEVIPGIQQSDTELFQIYGRVALTGNPEKFEIYLEALKQWFSVSVYSPGKEYFVAIFDIVTERKRTEEALRKSKERFHQLFDNMGNCSAVYEAVEGGEDFIIKNLNRAAERLEKVKRENILGKPVQEVFPGVKQFGLLEVFKRVWKTGEPEHHPISLYEDNRISGWRENFVYKLPSGEVVAIYDDITQRKQTEEALREQEKQYRQLIDQAADGIFLCDAGGRFLLVNSKCCELLGYTEDELYHLNILDTYPEESRDLGRQRLTLLKSGEPLRFERPMRRKDGSLFMAEASASKLDDGRLQSIIRDITERKQAEKLMRESEEKYRLITDNITDIILTTDISGMYTFISSSHKRVLDRGEEVLGRSIFEHIHPEDIPGVIATFDESVKSRGIARAEYRYLHPSRGYIWLESDGMLIDMQGTLTGVIVSRDITARKHADEALRESEEKFRQLFQSMVTGFALHEIICDEKGAPKDYRFLEVNPAFEQLTGLKGEDLVGRTVREVLPDTEHYWIDLYGKVALTGNPIHFENFTGALNKYFEVSAYSPRPGQFAAVFLDITERKRAEEELQKQHDLLTQLVETGPVGIAFVNAGGKIIFENTRAEEILGLSKTDITRLEYNAPAWRITDLDGKPFPMEDLPFMQVMKTRKPVKDIQHAIEWPDGRRVLLSINGAPLISATGEFNGMVATFEDITERKHLEEERIRLEERLQQSYKMEAIGSLAGGIAHDFNNILSSVFGFAELAKMKLEDKANIENELDEILKAGFRARDLVKQILTFSRQAGIKREPMMVVPLIKETLKFIRASLPVTIEIRQELPVSGSMIIADPTQIHQVIMNLCTNAAQAMKEKGGMLDVRLAEVELNDEAELDFKGLKRGRYLRLSVTDTGSGIPKEIINRIFDPFFTTKERGEGTGMGLSVVHGIVKDMGGAISVYSDPCTGTTFNILFPLYRGQAVEAHTLNTLVKTGRGRILFVDDEEGVIVSGRGILEQLGYEITSTTSPIEALELFTSDPDAFDLVLTDLTMPKMTGLELSERILKIRADTPIVLCTGFSLGISPERIRDAGISELVMKPMVASELSEAVYKALNPGKG
jgi:PAS domain S-box-containing protein